jgi:hypothetical protein
MICEVLRDRDQHMLAQFTSLTKILFHRHISTRRRVPTHGILIAPNYSAYRFRVYIAQNTVPHYYNNIICGEMKAGENIYE